MPKLEEYKAQGRSAFAAKQYKKAAKIYRDGLAEFGNDPVLLANRAQCFINLGDWDRAYKDCVDGLKSHPTESIMLKLMFRKAVASKNLGSAAEAREILSKILESDPHNKEAVREMGTLQDVPRSKKLKYNKPIEIPIEHVPNLPDEFALILSPDSYPKQAFDDNRVNDAASELFGGSLKNENGSKFEKKQSFPFALMPSMYKLKLLAQTSNDQKRKAFRYVMSMSHDDLKSLFETLGLDHEFLTFYLEAATDTLHSDSSAHTVKSIVDTIELFSTFGRYELALKMCDNAPLSSFIDVMRLIDAERGSMLEQLIGGA